MDEVKLQVPFNNGKSVAVFSNRDTEKSNFFNLVKIKGEQKKLELREVRGMLRSFKESYRLNDWSDKWDDESS